MKKLLAFLDRSWVYWVLLWMVVFIVSDIIGSLIGVTEVTTISLLKSLGLGLVMGVLINWVRKQDKDLNSKKQDK